MFKNRWPALTTGLALFSMFFGSGNLVFPLTVGQESEGHYFVAALGIVLTGVVVPFLGVFGMLLYKGEVSEFFNCFGKKGIFLFSLFALALMGPFGVLARCITVAHGAVLLILPHASLPLTSLLLSVLIYLLASNKSRLVSLLGVGLTPFLILSIAVIAYFGFTQGEIPEEVLEGRWKAFFTGFFQGYQTMDLLAAFFFSHFILQHLSYKKSGEGDKKNSVRVFYEASLIGAGILSAVYFVLVLMGSIYSSILNGKAPQEMLGIIAMKTLGSMAGPVVCVAVILACLTTAVVLASLFSDFLKSQVLKEKIGNRLALSITLGISFIISTLDFAGIASFLGPVLEWIYPALIALTLANIILKFSGKKASHWPFTMALVAKFWFT